MCGWMQDRTGVGCGEPGGVLDAHWASGPGYEAPGKGRRPAGGIEPPNTSTGEIVGMLGVAYGTRGGVQGKLRRPNQMYSTRYRFQ